MLWCQPSSIGYNPNSNALLNMIWPALLLGLLLARTSQLTTINTVSASLATINSVAVYTWNVTFDSTTPRSPLNLIFPSAISVSGASTVTVNSAAADSTTLVDSNTLEITSTNTHSEAIIVVNNVQNPNSAITTHAFSIQNSIDSTVTLAEAQGTTFVGSNFASCPWSFTGCTEAPGSTLTVTVTTVNPLPAGASQFIISYKNNWAQHEAKSMASGLTSSSLTCAYSSDGGTSYVTSGVSCTLGASQSITVSYTLGSEVAASTVMVYRVEGVNTPPTQTTSTDITYKVESADGNGVTIDSKSNCAIEDVCVTTLTDGAFTNSTQVVNALYGNPEVTFSNTPVYVTLQQSDTIRVYFSPFASVASCSQLRLKRNDTYTAMDATAAAGDYIWVAFPSTYSRNQKYSFPFQIFLVCSAFRVPESATPQVMSLNFYRNDVAYLQLNATMSPTADPILATSTALTVADASMAATTTYTFVFNNTHPLSSSAALELTLPADITVPASPTCAVTLTTATLTADGCSGSGQVISFNLTTSSGIAAGDSISLQLSSITNPLQPSTYSFGLTTYYSSTDSTSKVEEATTAFSATYTAIANHPVALTPTSMTVYTTTTVTLTLTNQVALPANTEFVVVFPTDVSSLTALSPTISNNGTAVALAVNAAVTSNNLTFTTSQVIDINSPITIQASIVTPSSLGSYSFVQLYTTSAGVSYLSSSASLALNVDILSFMVASVTPASPTAGATTDYTITLTVQIPHPASFTVQVTVPSDTTFNTVGASCTSDCQSAVTVTNTSHFTFLATNSNPNATGFQLTFTISSFTAPGKVATGEAWTVATSNTSPYTQISTQTAQPQITTPNTLTGLLSLDYDYYRSNTEVVRFELSWVNTLASGDYFKLEMLSTVYNESSSASISCSGEFGTCAKESSSTAGYLVVKVTPNISRISDNSMYFILENMVSGSSTLYEVNQTITITTLTAADQQRDTGTVRYNISCREQVSYSCRTCNSTNLCLTCYTAEGYFMTSGALCVNDCGTNTQYLSYANSSSGTCETCVSPCKTCESDTKCLSCVNSTYYLYTDNYTCANSCPITNGYYADNSTGTPFCYPCVSSLCLECSGGGALDCTKCNSAYVLDGGECLTNCSATNEYVDSNGACQTCDASCYTCTASGHGSCSRCESNYYSYNGFCLSACPTGTAIDPTSANCSCASECLECSAYSTCTSCSNSSQFVYNGGCVSSCPTGSYLTGGTCESCGTGCDTCSSSGCTACSSSYYLFGGQCYTDCNTISSQYDYDGTQCVLCPTGCDTCSGTSCSSCLTDYSLSSNNLCVKTCLITNTCDEDDSVLPAPGLIALVVWVGVVAAIKLIVGSAFVLYSFMTLSAVIQLVIQVGCASVVDDLPTSIATRLLAEATYPHRETMLGLLVASLVVNYLLNGVYLIIFVKYIKPLIANPKQIDVISNVVVLVLATLSNFRFGLLAFARVLPKPHIHLDNPSRLTPVHYLCGAAICLDVLPIAAAGLGIYNEPARSDLFMLSIDLLVIIVFNFIVTICFMASDKSEDYYSDPTKKYHLEESHNPTDETLPNDLRNNSKAQIVANESIHSEDYDLKDTFVLPLHRQPSDSYKHFTPSARKHSGLSEKDFVDPSPHPSLEPHDTRIESLDGSRNREVDPTADPDFEHNLRPRPSRVTRLAVKADRNASSGKKMEEGPAPHHRAETGKVSTSNLGNPDVMVPERDIAEELEESDYPELEENSTKGRESALDNRPPERVPRPRRVGTEKGSLRPGGKVAPASRRSQEKMAKPAKKEQRVGYFESDAYDDSNNEKDELEEIIRQKVWQSMIKRPRKGREEARGKGEGSEVSNDEVSPSWFNVENQRLELSDFGEGEQPE